MASTTAQEIPTSKRRTNGSTEDCIAKCLECYRTCLETLPHCLKRGGKHAEQTHIVLLTNCARICQTSAEFMMTGSPLHVHTCAACAEVCHACAEDCARMEDDDQMRRCAEACRRCAESCRQMSAH